MTATNLPPFPPEQAEYQISLWSQANVLLRQWRLVTFVPVIAGIAGLVFAQLQTRQYLASARFTPQELPTLGAGIGQLAAQLGVTPGRVGTYSPQFYADLVESREILRGVAEAEYAFDDVRFKGTLFDYFQIKGPTPESILEQAITILRARVVTRADRNNVVSVEVQTASAEASRQIVNKILDQINDFNLNRRRSQARAEREFTESRVAATKSELKAAEDSLAEFFKRNRVALSPELQAQAQRLTREVTVRQTVYLQLAQSFEAARIEEVRSTPLITVLERPEGFVLKQSKRSLQTAFLSAAGFGILAIILAFIRDGANRAKGTATGEYEEFLRLRAELGAQVRRALGPLQRLLPGRRAATG